MSRRALGGEIDLDPMSEAVFNERVRATRFFTEADDCFKHPWVATRLFINPAGGLVVQAWKYLIQEYQAGRTRSAIWIGFSVEQLGLLADEDPHPTDFSWLLPRKRIPFIRHDGFIGAPGHTNYVVGLGIARNDFHAAFVGRGKVNHGVFSTPLIPGTL